MKKILKNKALFVSLLAFLFSLVCFATIGYAWVVISKTASVDSFVGVMGDKTLDYQFSQIVDGDVVESHNVEAQNTMPGEANTFVLMVENKGETDANINVSFAKIFSEIDYADGNGYVKEYKNRYEKLQYAYSYCIDLIVYVEDGLRIDKIYGSDIVTVPTPEFVQQRNWIEFERNTEFNYFNKVDEVNNDINHYTFVHGLPLNHRNLDNPVATNKSTILIYFTIKFNSEPMFPGALPGSTPGQPTPVIPTIPDTVDFNGEYYANQKFHITNLSIEGLK